MGYRPIMNKFECLFAAEALILAGGISQIRPTDPEEKVEDGGYPKGCTHHTAGNLELYNKISTETTSCAADENRRCLCSGPGGRQPLVLCVALMW